MLMNEHVKLADVLEIVERYVAPRGRKGSVNLMREIESLPRIQTKELKCSVFIPDEWVRVYEEDAERIAKNEMINEMVEAIEKSGHVEIEKSREERWEPGKAGVRYTGSLMVGWRMDVVI